jgi:hypothetical protein
LDTADDEISSARAAPFQGAGFRHRNKNPHRDNLIQFCPLNIFIWPFWSGHF